jgi:outer membrane protein assembly factor BamD
MMMVVVAGCGSSEETTTLSAEERFQKAKMLFDDEDYLQASREFQIITLQFQGSAHADDAQFYVGECRFMRGEFALAAIEYSQLIQRMRASPLVPEAQYKLGLSYYSLSPESILDQQYTTKAIDELQTFVDYYPANEHAADAEAKIKELTTRLAEKEYENATMYSKLAYYKSAIIYYDGLIEKYHDTEYAPLAYLGKVEALVARNKYKEALSTIDKFLKLFPNSVLRAQADKLKSTIDQELRGKEQVTGKESGDNSSENSTFSPGIRDPK